MTTAARLEPFTVNVRVKMSALWASILFIFAYVDLFSLYRPDFRAGIEAGNIAGFTINQAFLLGTTVYIVIPSLMVFLALVLRPRCSRIANIALASLYALTITAALIGEWNYFILGSVVEIGLLATIVYYAWTWPRERRDLSRSDRETANSLAARVTRKGEPALMSAQGTVAAWRS